MLNPPTPAGMEAVDGMPVTGRMPEMLQDCSRKLSRALANTPHARLNATEAATYHRSVRELDDEINAELWAKELRVPMLGRDGK